MCVYWVMAIGSISLAIIALFQERIRSWFITPRLEVSTGSYFPYCQKILMRRLVSGKTDTVEIKEGDGYALRIAVRNVKPRFRLISRAENVEVFASKLYRKGEGGSFQQVQKFEPANLIWAHNFKYLADISTEMERFCFIGRMVKPEDRHNFPNFHNERFDMNQTCLKIDVTPERNTKEHIVEPGQYRLECLIGSANTSAIKKTVEFYISGEWNDNEIEMLKNHLTVHEVTLKKNAA